MEWVNWYLHFMKAIDTLDAFEEISEMYLPYKFFVMLAEFGPDLNISTAFEWNVVHAFMIPGG